MTNGLFSFRNMWARQERCWRVFTDGAIRLGRNASGLAAVVRDENMQVCHWWSKRVGRLTCNEAEYEAVIMALENLRAYRPAEIAIYSDSRVVVEQMLGRASVKAATLHQPNLRLRALVNEFGGVHFFYIPREHNRLADALANEAVDGWKGDL